MCLAVDVHQSQRHIKTLIKGLLVDDEHERVSDEAQVRVFDYWVVRTAHGCTIARRHRKQLHRACLARLFDERILIAFIQLETLNSAYVNQRLLDFEGWHPQIIDLLKVVTIKGLQQREDLIVRLVLILGRLHQENEVHGRIAVLNHKDLAEISVDIC